MRSHSTKACKTSPRDLDAIIAEDGPVAQAIQDFPWETTPIGARETWPSLLKTTLALVLSSKNVRLLLWGPDRLTFYNDAYLPHLGTAFQSGIGRPAAEFRPDVWPVLEPLVAAAFAGEGQMLRDYCLSSRRSGSEETIYVTMSMAPVIDEEGEVRGVLCDIYERTSQIEFQERLRAENSHFRELFDQAPVFMALGRTSDYRFQWVNRAYEELVGHKDLAGKVVWEAMPEAEAQGFVDLLRHVQETGQPFFGRDVAYTRNGPDGPEERFIDFAYQPFKDSSGNVTGILCVGYDVTEEHVSKINTRELKAQLAQASRLSAMGTMAATLAHELNQPLTAASNYLSGARRALKKDAVDLQLANQGVQSAERQILRAGDIIRRARSLLGQQGSQKEGTSVSALISKCRKSLAGDPICQAQYVIDIDEAADLVWADSVQIEQVLSNLIRNACQAVDEPPAKVTISARSDGSCSNVTITDNGRGLPQKTDIFEGFVQSTSGGLGLGLAISRTIVEAHGGRISARSAYGGGTHVTFSLPLYNPP